MRIAIGKNLRHLLDGRTFVRVVTSWIRPQPNDALFGHYGLQRLQVEVKFVHRDVIQLLTNITTSGSSFS